MEINGVAGYSLKSLDTINVILGKNGCGKSTLLKQVENSLSNTEGWGKTKYITPERGGTLTLDTGIESNLYTNPKWLGETRRVNQYMQFRQQSVAQYKKLELLVLREIATIKREDKSYNFSKYIELINTLLDNIEIRGDEQTFKIYKKNSDLELPPSNISSGESELISLGIECLIFSKELVEGKTNILFLDEPDVHLHPDLQSRLVSFLKSLVENNDFTVIIATHSTAMLGELSEYSKASLAFMKSDQKVVNFNKISDIYRKVLPVFGAHPLSNVFNSAPVMLLEGEDDERIWQQAVRSSVGKIKIYPVSCGGKSFIPTFEDGVVQILESIYDQAKAYSLVDRDDTATEPIDNLPLIRLKLQCRSAENMILSDDVISQASLTWDTVKKKIDLWLANNPTHKYHAEMTKFKEEGYNRKSFDLKNLRLILVADILESRKPWEILVGKTISDIRSNQSTINHEVEGSLANYLGDKIIR